MREEVSFFLQGIKKFREVGTLTRSSTAMSKEIALKVPSQSKYVVELGAGDGVITRYILDQMSPDGILIAFEINEKLYKALSEINDPRLIAVKESAEKMEEFLALHDIDSVDAIVSALPFIVMDKHVTDQILASSNKHLREGGKYIQLNYAKKLVKKYKSVFGNIEIDKIMKNLPPAYVFTCIKMSEVESKPTLKTQV